MTTCTYIGYVNLTYQLELSERRDPQLEKCLPKDPAVRHFPNQLLMGWAQSISVVPPLGQLVLGSIRKLAEQARGSNISLFRSLSLLIFRIFLLLMLGTFSVVTSKQVFFRLTVHQLTRQLQKMLISSIFLVLPIYI